MFYEIQPSILGLGDINAAQNKSMKLFGLGGHYAITKTEIIFEEGRFETILTGYWQATNDERSEAEKRKVEGQVIGLEDSYGK